MPIPKEPTRIEINGRPSKADAVRVVKIHRDDPGIGSRLLDEATKAKAAEATP